MNNLIDTYAAEVGRHLPTKNRADIEAEIRSALQDMLEERSRKEDRPLDDEMTYAVLKEYGDPEKVAASYLPERYLIGPAFYPIFEQIGKLILMITGIVVLVQLGINLGQSALDFQTGLEIVGKAIGNYATSVISALGTLVFILALIEWGVRFSGEKVEIKDLSGKKEWDPHSLGQIAPPNRIKMGDTIAEIAGSFIAILLFNFYPQIFTLGYSSGGRWYVGTGNWTSVPLLSQTFFHYVPILTGVWVLTIVLDILLLQKGYWNTGTRIYSIALKVASIAIAAAMLAGPSLIALTASSLPSTLASLQGIQTLMQLLPQIVKVALWLGILGNVIEIIRSVSRMISAKPLVAAISGKNS